MVVHLPSCRKRGRVGVQGSLSRPLSLARPAHLSFVTVPRTATVEMAGLAVAAVMTATMGPGGTVAVATSGGTAPARVEVASTGAGEVGPGSVLVALCGRHGLSCLDCPEVPTAAGMLPIAVNGVGPATLTALTRVCPDAPSQPRAPQPGSHLASTCFP